MKRTFNLIQRWRLRSLIYFHIHQKDIESGRQVLKKALVYLNKLDVNEERTRIYHEIGDACTMGIHDSIMTTLSEAGDIAAKVRRGDIDVEDIRKFHADVELMNDIPMREYFSYRGTPTYREVISAVLDMKDLVQEYVNSSKGVQENGWPSTNTEAILILGLISIDRALTTGCIDLIAKLSDAWDGESR